MSSEPVGDPLVIPSEGRLRITATGRLHFENTLGDPVILKKERRSTRAAFSFRKTAGNALPGTIARFEGITGSPAVTVSKHARIGGGGGDHLGDHRGDHQLGGAA
jgi:hypothetical protein